MNIVIVTDDNFFSAGFRHVLLENGLQCECADFTELTLDKVNRLSVVYDLVIFDISHISDFKKPIALNFIFYNILFVIDVPSFVMRGSPFFISKKSRFDDFPLSIRQDVFFKTPKIKQVEFEVLHRSSSGESTTTIASLLDIHEKTIYRLRYNLVLKFGFLRYHPLMGLYCEKISSFLVARKKRKALVFYKDSI